MRGGSETQTYRKAKGINCFASLLWWNDKCIKGSNTDWRIVFMHRILKAVELTYITFLFCCTYCQIFLWEYSCEKAVVMFDVESHKNHQKMRPLFVN